MMPGMPGRRTHDYVRHGITTLFAASGIADGTVISEIHRQHRAVEFRKFLATIDKTVPEGLGIHLICDNYGTHKTPAIKAWLARHPREKMHFTPTGSSWINQVERWSGFLTGQLIRRGPHTRVQALEADIRTWIEHWNDDPKPFVWKKTAEEILGSLARYLQRISGAAHEPQWSPASSPEPGGAPGPRAGTATGPHRGVPHRGPRRDRTRPRLGRRRAVRGCHSVRPAAGRRLPRAAPGSGTRRTSGADLLGARRLRRRASAWPPAPG